MKIAIVAVPGIGNLGDDLISVLLVQKVLEKYPLAEIGVLHYPGTNDVPYPESKNVHILYYPQLSDVSTFVEKQKKIIRYLKDTDYILVGGGGLIQDSHTPFTIHTCFQFAFNYATKKAKVGMVGVGIGPIKGAYTRWYFNNVLNRCSFAQIRDQQSLSYINSKRVAAIPCADIVAGTDVSSLQMFPALEKKAVLGCSIRPWKSLDFNKITRLILNSCKRKNLSCQLFVFEYEKWYTEEYDYAVRIKTFLEENGVSAQVLCYAKDSWEEFSNAFSSVSYAIAVRFHANILWQKLGIKVLPISYAPKVQSLYEDKGGRVLQISTLETEVQTEDLFQQISLTETYELPDIEKYAYNSPSLPQQLIVKYTTLLHTAHTLYFGIKKRVIQKVFAKQNA